MSNVRIRPKAMIEEFCSQSSDMPYLLKMVLRGELINLPSFATEKERSKFKKHIRNDFEYLGRIGIDNPTKDDVIALSSLVWDHDFETPSKSNIEAYVGLRKLGIV